MFPKASKCSLPKYTSAAFDKHALLTSMKVIVLLCVSTGFYVLWTKYSVDFGPYAVNLNKIAYYFKKVPVNNNLPLKYILLWTRKGYDEDYFQNGRFVFVRRNCSFQNCYITANRNFFSNITKFDALFFNLRGLRRLKNDTLPTKRAPHQKYIFFGLESADMFPVCSPMFDQYFNWTASYRLDADIVLPYFIIKDLNGTVIGPKQGIQWIKDMQEIDEDLAGRLQNKTKVGAWFVSRCSTRNFRECFVFELRRFLGMKNRSIDVYGKCGKLKCDRSERSYCAKMLQNDYHFYMSLENSFAEDYVTEKLLLAVQNRVVPIVYGGANYSRFLPPGSYLDARAYSPHKMANRMLEIIRSKKMYRKYFRWTRYYTYHDATTANVCSLCSALNNKTKFETYSIYEDFRKWWNTPDFYKRCQARGKK